MSNEADSRVQQSQARLDKVNRQLQLLTHNADYYCPELSVKEKVTAALQGCYFKWTTSGLGVHAGEVFTLAKVCRINLFDLIQSELDADEPLDPINEGPVIAQLSRLIYGCEMMGSTSPEIQVSDVRPFILDHFILGHFDALVVPQVKAVLISHFKAMRVSLKSEVDLPMGTPVHLSYLMIMLVRAQLAYLDGDDTIDTWISTAPEQMPDCDPLLYPTNVFDTLRSDYNTYQPLPKQEIIDVFGPTNNLFTTYSELVKETLAPGTPLEQMNHCLMGVLSELSELRLATSASGAVGELGDAFWFAVNLAQLIDPDFDFKDCSIDMDTSESDARYIYRLTEELAGCTNQLGQLGDLLKSRIFYGKEWDAKDQKAAEDLSWNIVARLIGMIPVVDHALYLKPLDEPIAHLKDKTRCLYIADILARNILKLRKRYPGLGFSADAAINRDYEAESEASGLDIE